MNVILFIISMLVPAIAGFLMVSAILRKEAGFFEKLIYGFGAGAGLLTLTIFIAGLVGIKFGVVPLLLVFSPAFLLPIIFIMKIRDKEQYVLPYAERLEGWKLYLACVLAFWILLKTGFVLYEDAVRPIYSWDSWAHWSTGAKFFFYERGLNLDRSDEFFFGKDYRFLGHPLNLTLLQVWISLWLGRFSEVFAKSWAGIYFIGTLGILYFSLKRETNFYIALLAAFFLSSMPLFTYHGFEGYSDMPLGFYALGATACFWRYVTTEKARFLVLSGVLLGVCAFTKNEGLFFFAAVAFALFLYCLIEKKRFIPAFAALVVPFLLVGGPWLLFKFINGIGYGHGSMESGMKWLSDPKYGSAQPKKIHWEIFGPWFKYLFNSENFGLTFPFFAIFSVLGIGHIIKGKLKYAYIIAGSVIAMFVLVYLTVEVTAVLEGTGVNRNALTYLPIVFFVSALLAHRVLSGKDR